MGTIFLHEFTAASDRVDDLRRILHDLSRILAASEGWQSGRLLESRDEPGRFVLMAVWEAPEAHQRAVDSLPTDLLQRAMTLVASLPRAGPWIDRS